MSVCVCTRVFASAADLYKILYHDFGETNVYVYAWLYKRNYREFVELFVCVDACLNKPNYREIVDRLFTFTLVDVHETMVKFRIGIRFSPVGINENINLWIYICSCWYKRNYNEFWNWMFTFTHAHITETIVNAKHVLTSTPDYINETVVNLLNWLFAWMPVYINQTIVKLWIGCLRLPLLMYTKLSWNCEFEISFHQLI